MVIVRVVFTMHARARLIRYGIREEEVLDALLDPDEVVPGHSGRFVAHKYKGVYVLRVVYEQLGDALVVVTVYRARRERYERKRKG